MELKKSKRQINEIIIHCTATEAGFKFNAQDVDRWHRQRGFDCIGYHYVVLLDGTVEKGRDVNRVGAHCRGHNLNSIGVVYVGGLYAGVPADTRTPTQKASLLNLVSRLRSLYPDARVHGHRDFAQKDCPCFNASREYE